MGRPRRGTAPPRGETNERVGCTRNVFYVSQTTSVASRPRAGQSQWSFAEKAAGSVPSHLEFSRFCLKRPSHERRAWRSSEPWRRGQEMPMPVYRGRAYLILTYPPSEKCSLTSAQTRYAGSRPYPDRCTRRWTSRFGRSCFCGFGTIPCGQWSHTRNSSWKGMLRSGTSSITANSSFTISRQHHQHKTASPTSCVEQPVWRTWQVTVEYSLPL